MYDRYRELVAGTTIDGGTLLSTDYFNSFNEVIMLLGMVPELPMMLEEVQAWRFRSYEEHFRESGLPFASLAVEAFAHVPPETRERFDATVREMRQTVEEARAKLRPTEDEAELERVKLGAIEYSMRLQGLVDAGSAIVHGSQGSLDQSAVDDLF
jgi:hypothetical protein